MGISKQLFMHCGDEAKLGRDEDDLLYDSFTQKFWPSMGKELDQLVIVVSGSQRYGEYLRVKRFLKEEAACDFLAIDESTMDDGGR